MSESETSGPDRTVHLTPEAAVGQAKMAVVKPGPRTVKVQVGAAKVIPAAPTRDTAAADPQVRVVPSDSVVKKGDLLDQVVAATGVKRADAKSVVEALFAALSDHLQAGTTLQLPPLGRVRMVNSKDVGQGATAMTVKIRTPNAD